MIEQLFPKEVQTLEISPIDITGELYPEEEQLLSSANKVRQKEFKASRILARKLLKQFNIYDFPLLQGKDRQPLWPEHLCGSITHTNNYCAVVLGKKTNIKSLGLDAEIINLMDINLHSQICQSSEYQWIQTCPDNKKKENLTLIFSAKECFYKWQYPLTHTWLNFNDLNVTIHQEHHQFKIQVTNHLLHEFFRDTLFTGQYLFHQGLVLTGISN